MNTPERNILLLRSGKRGDEPTTAFSALYTLSSIAASSSRCCRAWFLPGRGWLAMSSCDASRRCSALVQRMVRVEGVRGRQGKALLCCGAGVDTAGASYGIWYGGTAAVAARRRRHAAASPQPRLPSLRLKTQNSKLPSPSGSRGVFSAAARHQAAQLLNAAEG